MKFPI